jgi:peroxiredoxin
MNSWRKKILFLLIILTCGFKFLSAQSIVIKGSAPDYQGDKIVFYAYSDQITYIEEELGNCTVNRNGDFICVLSLNEPRKIFANLDIYYCYLYVEPDLTYEIKLPAKEKKTKAQLLNPYFKAKEIHLGVVNYDEKELNYLIRTFDDMYDPAFNALAFKVYTQSEITGLDSSINNLSEPYINIQHQFFNNYIRFKLALLKHITYQNKSVSISKSTILDDEIFYNNPAYMDLFNQIFYLFFNYLTRLSEGEVIHQIIDADKSLIQLTETINRTGLFSNDSFKELVILKGMYDELYSNTFSKEALLTILDSLMIATNIHENREIAGNIKCKVTKLMTGYKPPDFELYTLDSVLTELSNLKGKYVYLNFCTSLSYNCLNHFEILKNLFQKYHDRLNVVTILVYDDPEKIRKIIKEKDYPWLFLFPEKESKVLNDYNIKAFPTYYLLDPEGILVMSPALSPTENFENYFKNL